MKIGLFYTDGNEILLGDNVKLIAGQIGEVVFERGAFGVGVQEGVDYNKIQESMNEIDWCCGNYYSGCLNDNFISLWELYWNFNCEEDVLYPLEKIENENY